MKTFLKISFLFLLSLTACGGGGGGGESSSSDTKGLVPRGVRVLHGSIDAPPFDIFTDKFLGKISFADVSSWNSLSQGDTQVQLKRSNTEDIIFTNKASLLGEERVTFVVSGDYRNSSSSVTVIKDVVEKIPQEEAKVRCVNAVQGLRAIECSFAGGAGEIVSLGSGSRFTTVAPGPVTYSAVSQAGSIASGTISLEGGEPYTLLITGEFGYFIKSTLELG